MLKLRTQLAVDTSDYARLGVCRNEAMRRFNAIAPGLGVSAEMIESSCAREAMDRVVKAVAESCVSMPVSLNDMAYAMMPGLMRSARPELLSANLVTGSPFALMRSMDSLCQLHRREVVMVKAICEISHNAVPQRQLVDSVGVPHPAFLVHSNPATASFAAPAG